MTRYPLTIGAAAVAELIGVSSGYLRTLRFDGVLSHRPEGKSAAAEYGPTDVATLAVFRSLTEAGLSRKGAAVLARLTGFPTARYLEHMPGVSELHSSEIDLTDAERAQCFAACDRELPESRFCYYAIPELIEDDPRSSAVFLASLDELEQIHPRGLLLDFKGIASEIAMRLTQPLVTYRIDSVSEMEAQQ
ncbi:hypothetical protein FPZ52_10555 [Qingshengfaniella alkalisoli]|uniref:HTH merR-type domain-containing protein n=1 Tax=Qingshengfaniella alkalisoli TaxID=2599296 RepID=A0A5B8I7Z2_9RHOB|nr:hypothetical protein FPZ52_10555 [Qingshengfaniella alkalisoli]